MANTTLTPDIIAAEAIMVLDNNLGMASRVFRGHEPEFAKTINGFKVGDTVSIRRPTDFTVRDGPTADNQDVVEGKTTIVVDKQKGIDFKFSSADLTLEINDFSERIIMPAMVQLANQVDTDLLSLYDDVWNWVGTPGQTVNSFADFAKAPERLSEGAVPVDRRSSMLSPADHWGLVGNQTTLFQPTNQAYREGSLGRIGGIETFESQNIQTHTNGAFGGTTLVDQALIDGTVTYAATKDTGVATIHIDGLTSATAAIKAGDVFTIANCYAVNPVTKARKSYLQQFVVTADATAASNEVDLIVSPPPIMSGAFQTVDVDSGTDLNDDAVTFLGTASTGYDQNLVFHRNAFAMVSVPLERPPGAVSVTQKTHKGLSARLIPYYDGTNDISNWRFDILYGVKTLDGRLATRLSGTA